MAMAWAIMPPARGPTMPIAVIEREWMELIITISRHRLERHSVGHNGRATWLRDKRPGGRMLLPHERDPHADLALERHRLVQELTSAGHGNRACVCRRDRQPRVQQPGTRSRPREEALAVSIAVMNWVWANSPASGNERLVVLALADAWCGQS
jgi:hypothetical protein